MAESKDNNQNKRVHSSNSNFSIFLPNHILNEIEAYKNKNLNYSISTQNIQNINIQKKNEKKIEENSETINEQSIDKKEETYINDPRNFILKKSLNNNIHNYNLNKNYSFINRNLNQNNIPLNSMMNYHNFPNQNYFEINSNVPNLNNNMLNTYNPYFINRYQYLQNPMINPLLNSKNNQLNNLNYSINDNLKDIKQEKNKENLNNKNEIETNQHQFYDLQIDDIFSQVQKQKFSKQLIFLLENVNDEIFIRILKTHKGSRQLQKIITNNPPMKKEIDKIVKIISIDIKDIFCDYYGNYFLQKFFQFCSLDQRLFIYNNIKPNFIKISNDICGNHSLQNLIILQNSKEEETLIKECIINNLYNLSLGSNSSHVIQKIIYAIKEDNREYINKFMINNLMNLSLNPNGICVVKEFIIQTKNPFYILSIVSIFEIDIKKLTYNQFGNFAVQEAIKIFGEKYCSKIIKNLVEHIVHFSVSKFSSNVIDFIIDFFSKNNFSQFLEILSTIFLNKENLDIMLKNKFSNYVLENSLNIINNINSTFIDHINHVNKDEFFNSFLILKNNIYLSLKNNPIVKKKKKIMKFLKNYV